jgi:hypothetical protein
LVAKGKPSHAAFMTPIAGRPICRTS